MKERRGKEKDSSIDVVQSSGDTGGDTESVESSSSNDSPQALKVLNLPLTREERNMKVTFIPVSIMLVTSGFSLKQFHFSF